MYYKYNQTYTEHLQINTVYQSNTYIITRQYINYKPKPI